MAGSSEEPKFSLRLIIDKEKNKVVLAEACKDFVDVLFSFLTLPMGNIVKLLEKHQKSESVTVGCFNNLYKSVVDMSIDNFETEACKEMLLYPRSLRDAQCKKLKLNMNPTDDDDLTYYGCSSCLDCKTLSNFSTSLCRCGELMNVVGKVTISTDEAVDKIQSGVFTSGRSAFIITDDLKVAVMSTALILKQLKSLDCGDASKVGERLVEIGFEEVITLFQCIFSSKAPLTDTFLNKKTPKDVMKSCELLSGPCMKRESEDEPIEETITLSAVVRKQDMKVLYVECGEDFVDLLFTFLALPMESLLELSGDSSNFGCIGNLFKSFKDMSAGSTTKSMLPHYYKCKKQLLLNITTEPPLNVLITATKEPVVLIDPKSHGIKPSAEGSWFVKRDTKFIVSNDLIITPMISSSVFCLLKKMETQAEDLEVQEISITKTEATNLLRASLVTSSALNGALIKLIVKKTRHEDRQILAKSTSSSIFRNKSFSILLYLLSSCFLSRE